MKYKVPRNIEHETKIIGPASFQQLLYLGGAAFLIFFLYFILGNISMGLFYFVSFVIAMIGLALAFLKIDEMPLPQYLKNFMNFSTTSREYVWKKKKMPMQVSTERRKREPEKKDDEDEDKDQGIRRDSRLSKIGTKIETSQ